MTKIAKSDKHKHVYLQDQGVILPHSIRITRWVRQCSEDPVAVIHKATKQNVTTYYPNVKQYLRKINPTVD